MCCWIVHTWRWLLSQRHIHHHHDDKPKQCETGRQVSVVPLLRLGDQFFDHDKDHRPGCKGQGIGQNWGDQLDGQCAEQPPDRLDNAGGLSCPEGLAALKPFTTQRNRDSHPFRKILQSDSDRQGDGCPQRGDRVIGSDGAKGDADRQSLKRDRFFEDGR